MADNATISSALTIADLNTAINHEPRILDIRIGECLGMVQPLNIRKTIEANRTELEGYGLVHAVREPIRSGKGRIQEVTAYWLNEAQTLLLCMFSRTARAAQVRKEVIEAYMAWRRGERLPAPRTTVVRRHIRCLPAKASAPEPWRCGWRKAAGDLADDPGVAVWSAVLHVHEITRDLYPVLRQGGIDEARARAMCRRLMDAASDLGNDAGSTVALS